MLEAPCVCATWCVGLQLGSFRENLINRATAVINEDDNLLFSGVCISHLTPQVDEVVKGPATLC